MSEVALTRQSEYRQPFFGAVAEEIGQATGFVQRASKLTSAVLLATLVLGWLVHVGKNKVAIKPATDDLYKSTYRAWLYD
jgi:hypothetical protein